MNGLWVLILSLLLLGWCDADPRQKGPAIVKGDFVIGALFSVHHQPKQKGSSSLTCGEIREMYGIQRVEVTFQTLDRINSDPTLLPNITLGVEIRDSCWYAPVALQQSIEFIRDAIAPEPEGKDIRWRNASDTCAALVSKPRQKRPMIGVIGPGSSSVALQVQNLLQLFHIPQIGYSTTSKDLSDKRRFSYFMRVVPSDYFQAQVMIDIVRKHNWTYVSAVNTDENYGQSGIQAFRELAERNNICIAKEDSVLSNAEEDKFDNVMKNLGQDENARVVVCFCEGMTVRGLLAAIGRLNMTGRFLLLGSDGWADRADVVDAYEKEAEGSLSVRIHSPYVSHFDEYYFKLNPFNNARNPWFKEFWQSRFNCSMPGNTDTQLPWSEKCTGFEKLQHRHKQDPKMSFVIKAIYTMAYGLHNLQQDVCGRETVGLCPELFPFNGSLFKSYLLNVTFTYENDTLVEFDKKGDPPGRYDIMNFRRLPNGTFDYVHVGDWNNGTLDLWDDGIQYSGQDENGRVESVCSKPCPLGYYKNFQSGGQEQRCCWVCVPCEKYEFLLNDTTCKACRLGYVPNESKTSCYKIQEEFVQWSDTQAIVAIFFACLGFVTTVGSATVFIRYNDTPVVKSSTRELSYLILTGMCISHASTFPILARPSKISCYLTRVMPGLSFAMIYAALVTKTNRIARILAGSKKRFPTRKPRFMSATAQVLISCSLIAIELGVITAMLIIEPADSTLVFPVRNRAVLTCNTTPQGVVAPLTFDFLLIALCTLYALKTRNVPENFNEAKFIGFAMYTTCVIWIAFVPIYFGSDSKAITMCMCVTLSAMVTLVFLFFPKLYIILLRPERNNRSFFTTSKTIRCHIGRRVASKSSNSTSDYSAADSPCAIAFRNSTPLGPKRITIMEKSFSERDKRCYQNNGNWKMGSELDLAGTGEKHVEQRTLSCQTGDELLQYLLPKLERHMQNSGRWLELSPRALLQQAAHIIEESASDQSDEDSGQFKQITISLGSLDPLQITQNHALLFGANNMVFTNPLQSAQETERASSVCDSPWSDSNTKTPPPDESDLSDSYSPSPI